MGCVEFNVAKQRSDGVCARAISGALDGGNERGEEHIRSVP